MYGLNFSTRVSTSPPRADAILTRRDFHKVSRALGPQETGVQHAEKTDLGSQVFRVSGDFDQRFGAGPEKKIVERFLVLQCECRQVVRKREDDMQVRNSE